MEAHNNGIPPNGNHSSFNKLYDNEKFPEMDETPEGLTNTDAQGDDAQMRNASRFKVAKVEFSVDGAKVDTQEDNECVTPPVRGHNDMSWTQGGGSYDTTQAQKTFGRNTLEMLPHEDHYRNLLSTTGQMKQRPTLMELHELDRAVSTEHNNMYYYNKNLKATLSPKESFVSCLSLFWHRTWKRDCTGTSYPRHMDNYIYVNKRSTYEFVGKT